MGPETQISAQPGRTRPLASWDPPPRAPGARQNHLHHPTLGTLRVGLGELPGWKSRAR